MNKKYIQYDLFGHCSPVSYTARVFPSPMSKVLKICHGKSCMRAASQLEQAALARIEKLNAQDTVRVESCGCLGKCKLGPNIRVYRDGTSTDYRGMSPRTIEQRVDELVSNKPVIEPGKAQRSVNDLLKGGF